MLRLFTTALVVFVTTSLALGDLRIRQWNPNITTGFTIEEDIRKITITTGQPTEVFKFEAYDDVTNLPETINEITVQSGAGIVLLAVIGDPSGGRTLGASDLEKLDLSEASSSTLVQVKIDADLGEDGPTKADSLAAAGGLPAIMEVGGNLLNDIELTASADGDIYINGPGPHNGNISISGSAQDIEINNDFTGVVSIGADLEELLINGGFAGRLDIGGSVHYVDIEAWLSPSPAYIYVGGNAWNILVQAGSNPDTPVEGDIFIDGDIDHLNFWTDFAGSIDIGGTASVQVLGGILDSGENYVRIGRLDPFEHFECQDMELSGGPDQWLTFGTGGPVLGVISVHGELSGVLCVYGPSESSILVGDINAGPEPDPDMQYGGIYFAGSTSCDVTVTGSLKQGWIFASGYSASGGIAIFGSVGQESPSTVARIFTGTAETSGEPTLFAWNLAVHCDIWPNAGSEPAIYVPGDLLGRVACHSLEAGATIRVAGNVADDADITVYDTAFGNVVVEGDLDGDIVARSIEQSGYCAVMGQLHGTVLSFVYLQGTVEVFGDMLGKIAVLAGPIDGGRIHVYGSLCDKAGDEIWATEILNGAIAIDYDGWDEADYWHEGATVNIGGTPYDGNTPEEHIWEIQRCKGDMNNYDDLDSEDPNVLWHVVNDPNYDYATEFPGLRDNRDSHLLFESGLKTNGSRRNESSGRRVRLDAPFAFADAFIEVGAASRTLHCCVHIQMVRQNAPCAAR